MQTGASLGIVAKAVWQVTASTSLRASAKLGTMGMELELGGNQQVTEFSSAGCSVVTGLQVQSTRSGMFWAQMTALFCSVYSAPQHITLQS